MKPQSVTVGGIGAVRGAVQLKKKFKKKKKKEPDFELFINVLGVPTKLNILIFDKQFELLLTY